MKRDELQKLREKSLTELRAKIVELKKQTAKAKLEKEAQKLKNVAEVKRLRQDLARVLTILRMKELMTDFTETVSKKEDTK